MIASINVKEGAKNNQRINEKILPIVPGANGTLPVKKQVLINDENNFIYLIKLKIYFSHYYNNNEHQYIKSLLL